MEGRDFQVIGKFALKLGEAGVGNRRDFAVIPVGGFNPDRIRSLKLGMEATLGAKVAAAAILDRDYRSAGECQQLAQGMLSFCHSVHIHQRKEIENFLLVPAAIDRALARRVRERNDRSSDAPLEYQAQAAVWLEEFCSAERNNIVSQMLKDRRQFERGNSPTLDEADVSKRLLDEVEERWSVPLSRFDLVSGKDAVSLINRRAQEAYGVSVTPAAIVSVMRVDEVPAEMRELVELLVSFGELKPETL